MTFLKEWAMNLSAHDQVRRDALDVLRDLLTVAAVYADDPELAAAVERLAVRAKVILERERA